MAGLGPIQTRDEKTKSATRGLRRRYQPMADDVEQNPELQAGYVKPAETPIDMGKEDHHD